MKKFMQTVTTTILTSVFLALPLQGLATALGIPNQQIPEVNGTYDETGIPNIKVRVIVHQARSTGNSKPGSSTPPTLDCTLTDPNSPAVVPAAGWQLPSTVVYRLNTGSVPSTVDSGNLATIAANGFSDWAAAISNSVTFTRGSDTSANRQSYDGQNIISWGKTSRGTLGVTYIRYNTTTNTVVDVDTIMNNSYTWYWSTTPNCAYSGVYDAEDILTHELGHWVGLDDTYDAGYTDNTMYGYGTKTEVKKDTLTDGDIAGASQIYN